jgi:hypothetical protein
MHVIGHEDISVHMAGSIGSVLPEKGQVDQVIGLADKTGAAIIPALDDVQRYCREYQAWTTCHG